MCHHPEEFDTVDNMMLLLDIVNLCQRQKVLYIYDTSEVCLR